ncbi:MAG: elongation factor Ts, partial [Rhizobiales bacterium]|nr:elongation factor Ts [Hyphomicrobiales bacterium]
MSITAAMVKELRERTGAGMMECKKALVATSGDIEVAIEQMRKSGQAKADKKAGRVAAEGTIRVEPGVDGRSAAIIEVNSETDFVAKDDSFLAFAAQVANAVQSAAPADLEALMAVPLSDGNSVDETRRALIAKLGENINTRRFDRIDGAGALGSYLHGQKIGVLVALDGGDENLARDVAMHIAASKPQCVSAEQLPKAMLDKEREILVEQAADSGKPAEIISKMVEGRMRKFVNEITLIGQPFVKDPDITVG